MSLELRAATALAAISDRARERLTALVASFDDDATPDLAEARDALARPVPRARS